jgi:hypothetical protein
MRLPKPDSEYADSSTGELTYHPPDVRQILQYPPVRLFIAQS